MFPSADDMSEYVRLLFIESFEIDPLLLDENERELHPITRKIIIDTKNDAKLDHKQEIDFM